MRAVRLFTVAALASFAIFTWLYLRIPQRNIPYDTTGASRPATPAPAPAQPPPVEHFATAPPPEQRGPLQSTNTKLHPIDQLSREAEQQWTATLERQSRTLAEAVAEYKRRYRMPPPPHFDKWFEFATKNKTKIIDEYDTIYHSLLPFWGLSPATIRARTREAAGYDKNNLMVMQIRKGKVDMAESGPDWLREAVQGMLKNFIHHLPDMDLAFNVHDEPRVVVPHDQLSALLNVALDQTIPAALANPSPKNAFSQPPSDLSNKKRFDEVKTSRFNVFAHQQTWVPSRLSCPVDSPARTLEEHAAKDNLTSWALTDLGFVYNQTAFSDVCNSPSLEKNHGFFERPNAFNVVHDLFPVFSQSKMSTFQDILYPSPWYWSGQVAYDKERDMEWNAKGSALWWRGSTTGGFSRGGGWRRQHRQNMVKKLSDLNKAKIMQDTHKDQGGTADWTVAEVPRPDYKDIIDVRFSHIGQCDPGDCDAQREFFDIAERADQQDAWKYRYLLDMDGNAFSGRFYAFLQSHSIALKMAVFREWHEEWIKPWVHYIPLSLQAEEALEAVRYLSAEDEGKKQAARMAEVSREWAQQALRNADFEVWFFRLLLEYGRLVDDNRMSIGCVG